MSCLKHYINCFHHLRRGVTKFGPAPHKLILLLYTPSEPHGEGDIAVELWKKLELGENDAVWRLSARRHSPLHNNEPELIDYFVSPLGIRESICSAGVEFKRGRTSSSHLRKQMPFALHVAANEYRIASRYLRNRPAPPELSGRSVASAAPTHVCHL